MYLLLKDLANELGLVSYLGLVEEGLIEGGKLIGGDVARLLKEPKLEVGALLSDLVKEH
jgi:hypothetical protein